MRRFLSIALFLLFVTTTRAQSPDKPVNVIEIDGYATIPVQPSFYTAIITIQETEQKVGYTTVGKVPIDSIKLFMYDALKKFRLDPKELKLIGTSSRDLYGGQLPFTMLSLTYAYKLSSKEQVQDLINDLKFTGLKGIIMNWTTTDEKKSTLRDSVYHLALRDAQKTAEKLAASMNKKVGGVKNVTAFPPDVTRLDKDIQQFDPYSGFRFEYDTRDLFIKGSVRASFELK